MSKSIDKPLGGKAYGSIPHLPGSKVGPKEITVDSKMTGYFTKRVKDKGDKVIVQEKTDGSCVAVAKHEGNLLPLIRVGYAANTSPFKMHQLFHNWVFENQDRFDTLLEDGERVAGEWLLQAHGIIYDLPHEPFVAFDILKGIQRTRNHIFEQRCKAVGLVVPNKISEEPITTEAAMKLLGSGKHGATDTPEGVIYRYEATAHDTITLTKFVRSDFQPGSYLPEMSGLEAVWNKFPSKPKLLEETTKQQ
jgi:hypothetical protein